MIYNKIINVRIINIFNTIINFFNLINNFLYGGDMDIVIIKNKKKVDWYSKPK